MIAAYGAELVLTPGAGTDIDLALDEDARDRARRTPIATSSPASSRTRTTREAQLASGEEIWEQTDGRIDAVVGVAGNRRMDHRRGAGAEGPRRRRCARSRSSRRSARSISRAAMGHARRARDRRRHHPAQPRPRRDGRHRDGVHRRGARHGAPPGPRGRACCAARRRASTWWPRSRSHAKHPELAPDRHGRSPTRASAT